MSPSKKRLIRRNKAKAYLQVPTIPNLYNALKSILGLSDPVNPHLNTGAPEILPGFLLKGLMRGNQLEKQLSKAGTISTNAVKALANKSSKLEGNLLNKILDNLFPALRAVDYDKFRHAILLELILYLTSPATKYADYGIDRLGYSAKISPETVRFNPDTGQFESLAVKTNTFTFESPRIPIGNAKHYNKNTLGHTRTFTDLNNPHTLNVLETLSDWAQNAWSKKTYDKMSLKAPHRLSQLRKIIALLMERNIPTVLTEARIPLLTLYKDVPSWHIQHLLLEYPLRLLLENMLYGARNGYNKMRYPTRSTAIKVEGYEPVLLFGDVNKEQYAIKLQEKIGQLELLLHQGTNPFMYRRLSSELLKAKREHELLKLLSTLQVYSPLQETVLKRYDDFPKLFGRVFKDLKPLIVTDSKGNSWFEFNIPSNILSMELLYKNGGIL